MTDALRSAIGLAKARRSKWVEADDVLLGCLLALSRFGIARIGAWRIDLEPLGVAWRDLPDVSGVKASYSDEAVKLLDEAAVIGLRDGTTKFEIPHLLVCFADTSSGLMGTLRQRYGIDSASWRAALAEMASPLTGPEPAAAAQPTRPYFTPEEAAAYLGVHIQTLRGYIRTAKLPALRIAGERAIRLRREDLEALLEPLLAPEIDKNPSA